MYLLCTVPHQDLHSFYTTLFRSATQRLHARTHHRQIVVFEPAADFHQRSNRIAQPQQVPPQHIEPFDRSEEHTSELQSLTNLVCRLLLEKTYLQISQV